MKIPLTKIKPNNGQIHGLPKNPRLIKDDRFEKLVKSIQDDPEMLELRELIVYPHEKEYIVIAGNMRLKAMQHLKYKDAPCKVLPENTPVEKLKAITIKDNVPFGENDWDSLSNEWDINELSDWGMEIPDFKLNENDAHDDNYELPEEIKTDIVIGDYFEIGEHRLICGDSTISETFEKLFKGLNADLVLTDPPYNVNYSEKNNALADYRPNKNKHRDIENDKMKDSDFYNFLKNFYTSLSTYVKGGGRGIFGTLIQRAQISGKQWLILA